MSDPAVSAAAPEAPPSPPRPKAPALSDPLPVGEDLKEETNPFTDRDPRMRIYSWSGLALRILLILGTIFSVVQYLDAREEKRVERALELVELWERPEYQEAQKAVKERLAGLNTRFASLLGPSPSATELAIYFKRVGQEAMTDGGGTLPLPEFQAQFDRLLYFLNRLSFCVEEGLCSRDVSDAYFRDYAVSFWSYFSGYAERERKRGSPNFAKPVEAYVKSGAPAPETAPAVAPVAARPSSGS